MTSTLSLIYDQVEQLNARGVPATFLCSTQKDLSVPEKIQAGRYKVVYITPERLFPRGQSTTANTVSNKAGDVHDWKPTAFLTGRVSGEYILDKH